MESSHKFNIENMELIENKNSFVIVKKQLSIDKCNQQVAEYTNDRSLIIDTNFKLKY